ncbi:MAG: NUDIX domain-containing protein [Flavobacteriales bacterium]|nr:NUDIX domain-containing protein [Flavobacteriales bacterium]
MPAARSAGLLIWKQTPHGKYVLLCHPGGPFYQNKDDEVWTIPKGLASPGEDLLQTAIRETYEECGFIPPEQAGYYVLPTVKYKNGKILYAWAIQVSENYSWNFKSNSFEVEWPPKSGSMQTFPEIDRMDWFILEDARRKIHPIQKPLLDAIETIASIKSFSKTHLHL